PRVSPEYGTRPESIPISAVPVSETAHAGSPGALAVPCAFQLITEPLSVPCAVPESFRSLAHVALNEPRALLPVCSVTFHLKSVQVLGDGTTLAEVQLPSSAATPVEPVGWVAVLVLS